MNSLTKYELFKKKIGILMKKMPIHVLFIQYITICLQKTSLNILPLRHRHYYWSDD